VVVIIVAYIEERQKSSVKYFSKSNCMNNNQVVEMGEGKK
jgi:hypothetical protein